MSNLEALIASPQPHDAGAVIEAFQPLTETAADRERAWKALARICERATSGQSVRRAKIFYEREIRRLGPVVAWQEMRVTEQRSLSRAGGAIHLRVAATVEDADRIVDEELSAAGCTWGYRPESDELADLQAHRLERERLIALGDPAALEAYCQRSVRTLLVAGSDGRLYGAEPWSVDGLVFDVATRGESAALLAAVLAKQPSQHALGEAAQQTIKRGRADLLALLVAQIENDEDDDEEDAVSGLLGLVAAAQLAARAPLATVLLARGANPNHVSSALRARQALGRAADDGNGPLVNAVRNADAELVALLLAHGGDPLAPTRAKRRVIDMAKDLGDPAIIAALEAGIAPDANLEVDMTTAVANGDIPRVLALLPTEGSATAIVACGFKENLPLLEAVLSAPHPHDAATLAKALWTSSCNGLAPTVELLLRHGADPNGHVSQSLGSARKMAEYNKHAAIAAMLKKAGGKIRVKT